MANPAYINDLREGIMQVLRDEFNNQTPSGYLHMKRIRKTTAKYTDSNTVEVALFAEANPHPAVFTVKVMAKKPSWFGKK